MPTLDMAVGSTNLAISPAASRSMLVADPGPDGTKGPDRSEGFSLREPAVNALQRASAEPPPPPPVEAFENPDEKSANRGSMASSWGLSSLGFRGSRFSSWDAEEDGEQENAGEEKKSTKAVFVDAAAMKAKLRENMYKKKYTVTDCYKTKGFCQFVARSRTFDLITLKVIALNALWLWPDTDHNKEVLWKAHPVFQVAEHSFCAFYVFEWIVRFGSFAIKSDCLHDYWFVFDSMLVLTTVAETWVMNVVMMLLGNDSGGGMGSTVVLRMARLLRLSRMARMARLLRAMPELMILIKGMVAACRSVLFTVGLLVMLTYVFAITFAQLTADTAIGEVYFENVSHAMATLFISGTLLDDVGRVLRKIGQESYIFASIFLIFILLAALTVMNMLIGVLCEVVAAVASVEKEDMIVNFVKHKMQQLMTEGGIDQDDDQLISKTEFVAMLQNRKATECLQEVGVDVVGLVDFADFIFESDDPESEEERELNFPDFMEVVLQLRGSNQATVKDIVDLRKFIRNSHKEALQAIRHPDQPLADLRRSRTFSSLEHADTMGSQCTLRQTAQRPSITRSKTAPLKFDAHPSAVVDDSLFSERNGVHKSVVIEDVGENDNTDVRTRVNNLASMVQDGLQELKELRRRHQRVERIMTNASNELNSLSRELEQSSSADSCYLRPSTAD